MYKRAKVSIICLLFYFLVATSTGALADTPTSGADSKSFDKLYADWTAAFNKKDMVGTMSIFSPTCVASLPDATHKTYDQIDAGFKKLFADKSKSYKYTYDVHNIYHTGDLAAVRITWHLATYENGKLLEKNNEHGLDVLQRDKKGAWQIVNWVAFAEHLPQ